MNKLMEKYKDIEAISMGSSESLVTSFHGFQDKDERLLDEEIENEKM